MKLIYKGNLYLEEATRFQKELKGNKELLKKVFYRVDDIKSRNEKETSFQIYLS